MAKNRNANDVTNLGLSRDLTDKLLGAGINTVEDINDAGYTLAQLAKMIDNNVLYKELEPIIKKYRIPALISNLDTTDELKLSLANAGIHTLDDFFTNRETVYVVVHTDETEDLLTRANVIYKFYEQNLLSDADEPEKEELPPEEVELVVEEHEEDCSLLVADRLNLEVLSNRKKYGSRQFTHFKIRLASPDEIRTWSYGEVKNHETINYRTSKPEEGGLFCEKIFGPIRDYQCHCGKKQVGSKGQVCARCGIEITESRVRRERMGHIELEAPIVHTWYLKNAPSPLATLLGIKTKTLVEVVYHTSYIIVDSGDVPFFEKGDDKEKGNEESRDRKLIISEQDYSVLSEKYGNRFKAMTGAEAIKYLLQTTDFDGVIANMQRNMSNTKVPKQIRDQYVKRIDIIKAFLNSDNKPEWMVMDVIPVIPPDLRPMVPLDGGRFATTDLNDLYRRILNRNNRLKKQKEVQAPRLVIKNEKRMLQEAVDSLFDNSKRGKKAVVERNRSLKSLSDLLKGKQGRFRQNLLGKRVDYSGRSVIVVGPDLKMYQCGIPREMAVTLFKPFILRELQKGERDRKSANRRYEEMGDDVWNALEKVVVEHPVLLNRAPTLHRLGIQAFEPKLIDGKAIRLHPLVTPAFNADFDGDQMAIHLPLSNEAQAEARLLMLASNNILNPKDGKPVVTPSQDMVLGNYYLTKEESKLENPKLHINEGKFFATFDEIEKAYNAKIITLHTRIVVNPNMLQSKFSAEQKTKYLVTTYGKIVFNQIFHGEFPYLQEPTFENILNGTPDCYFINKGVNPKDVIDKIKIPEAFDSKQLGRIISQVFKTNTISETSKMLDELKNLGFKYSTLSGITVSAADITVYSKKNELIQNAQTEIEEIDKFFDLGMLDDGERRTQVIKKWQNVQKTISDNIMKEFSKDNDLFVMSKSGARGKASNFAQLSGMRGLMNNPKGEIIDVPVLASFREGLTVSEFFISTHGARKGSTDTALKTAESGYLTRRLVDVAQDVIIVDDDCKTDKGYLVTDIKEEDKVIVPLYDRLVGRYLNRDVINPINDKTIAFKGTLIDEDLADIIKKSGVTEVEIRSVLMCNSNYGVCGLCYGRNLATNGRVEIGEAVGVIAAQSIGEPGTQLTMRTFHTGGVASTADITQGLPRVQELFESRNPKGAAIISDKEGKVFIEKTRNYSSLNHIELDIETSKDGTRELFKKIPLNADLIVNNKQNVKIGDKLTRGTLNPKELLRILNMEAAASYILAEVQKVYRSTGVELSDKHIEIIIRQMLKRIFILQEGDTTLLPGTEVSITEFREANKKVLENGGKLAVGKPLLLGITRASLRSDSFLSAASFQETTRILTDAAIRGKVDELHGLKENVIIGGLIPAGTGILADDYFKYSDSIIDED